MSVATTHLDTHTLSPPKDMVINKRREQAEQAQRAADKRADINDMHRIEDEQRKEAVSLADGSTCAREHKHACTRSPSCAQTRIHTLAYATSEPGSLSHPQHPQEKVESEKLAWKVSCQSSTSISIITSVARLLT